MVLLLQRILPRFTIRVGHWSRQMVGRAALRILTLSSFIHARERWTQSRRRKRARAAMTRTLCVTLDAYLWCIENASIARGVGVGHSCAHRRDFPLPSRSLRRATGGRPSLARSPRCMHVRSPQAETESREGRRRPRVLAHPARRPSLVPVRCTLSPRATSHELHTREPHQLECS